MRNGDVSDEFFNFGGEDRSERYANPFYNIPQQYLPTNMDGMLWWSQEFLMRFGFFRAAIQRVADYFITELLVECDDEEAVNEYKEAFEELRWKEVLAQSGLNQLAHSNDFLSINQGFNRFLTCPQCHKFSLIDRIENFEFNKGKYTYSCPSCSFKGVHKVVDKPLKDVKDINIVHWPAREIKIRFDEASGKSEHYWQIPQSYKKKVTAKGDRFYPKTVPSVIYEAIFEDKMIKFTKKNFLHVKMPTPSSLKTDGKSVPLCLYMFDDFFTLKVLERFNEVICYEDINPFRVIAMADNVPIQHPALSMQDGGDWSAAVDAMIENHRKDPGSYHKFPFPLNFQYLNRDGKQLAPVELIAEARNNILNAFNVPQEFYAMTLQSQAVGPALRLFENSWNSLIANYNKILQHMGEVIGRIRGLTPAKISLIPITFADDMERKSVIGQLVSSNSIARSEFLELYGFSYKDQLRKKMQEEREAAEIQEEEQKNQELKKINKASIFGQQGQAGGQPGMPQSPGASVGTGAGMSPQDILAQAQEIATQLQPMDGAQRREELQKIKAQNETLWSSVKAQLTQMDSGVKSQALQQSKQQGQQPGM